MTTTTLPSITHRITYDRETRDYACYVQVDGGPEQYIGSAGSYHAAEIKALEYRRDLLDGEALRTAAELDAPGAVYARPAEEPEMIAAEPTRTVTIPSCAGHGGFDWNKVTLTLRWICPKCGGPRGEPHTAFSFDGSRRLVVDGWINPCGHVDGYADVRDEAQAPAPEPYDDTLHIPARDLDGQCGDCGTALNEYGQCERCIEEYIHDQGRYADMAADEPAPWERLTDRARPAELFCFFCGGDKADHNTRDCPKVDNFENTSPSVFDPPAERPADRPRSLTFHSGMSFSIRQPPRCACGATAIIDEPAGLFCNGCHEGYTLFELQKHDPTLLVQRLVAEPDRRNEMVARVARYLSHKHKMEVSPPTVLIIWRELLSDYEGPDAPLSLMLAA